MISKTENKSKSREWEKETMTPNFNVETLRRDKKPQDIHYEEQKLNTRFFLAQAYRSFSDHLTSTLYFQLLTFFFRNTLGVYTKLDLGLFLNPHKKKLRDKWMKNQPIFFSRKSMENSLENNRKVRFSWQLNTPK